MERRLTGDRGLVDAVRDPALPLGPGGRQDLYGRLICPVDIAWTAPRLVGRLERQCRPADSSVAASGGARP